ncbi:hypothetical protein [Chryseobacterium sp. MP_3.2]|uniref:hypothetical protein n=1 Tax=Chryseobacterium sp. MP_3.2 TaxID=3071712 RepID=UPI002DFE438F|nr:hypothetical protein [Chryseobacterium sp. MP_3.2]
MQDLVFHFDYNRLTFDETFRKGSGISTYDKNFTLYSPIQKFNWVHVPSTDIDSKKAIFGIYKYTITPRYIENGKLLPIDKNLSVDVEISVKLYQ